MRPRIVLSAAAVGLGFAALLVWPRDEGPALRHDAPLRENEPPRGGVFSEAAPEPDEPLPETAPPDAAEMLDDDLEPPPESREADAPPESEPEADVDSGFAPLVGAGGQPSRTLVRAALADAVARDHPGLDLSPEALDRAADAVLRMRAAQMELAELALTSANAARRVALGKQLEKASLDFEREMGLAPSDFTKGVDTPGDVDEFDPEEQIPEPSFLGEPAPEGAG